MITFTKPTLIYVPVWNNAPFIVSTVAKIPPELMSSCDILIVDNCSDDGTSERVLEAKRDKVLPDHVVLIRTDENIGYAGSQKLAYALALENPCVRNVIMLHGDGQYSPELIHSLERYFDTDAAVVYGYRSKTTYGRKEETPWVTWLAIKVLSLLESLITGYWRREWHTGFIMYSTDFLRSVDLNALTTTRHIDGHLLYTSGFLKQKAVGVPIFKLYGEIPAFEGEERSQYIRDVFKLMFSFRSIQVKRPTDSKPVIPHFTVLSSSSSSQ